MGRFEHPLPAILEPVGDICLQLSIPAHPDYVALFIRAVRMLETNRLYVRDEALSAKIVVDQWRTRTITPMIEALASATGNCQDLDGECLTYPPFAGFISYSPQNPFTEPDLVPDGFEQPPFFVNGKDNAHDLPNYNKGDVILDFGSINIEPSWDLAKTPRIELCLTGSGVVEIHLLKIVQGGAAVISVDNPVDLGDLIGGLIGEGIEIIQLNQDIISLPPETAEEVIIELDIATEGDHIVYIYYLPVVNDSLIPLFFGGGLREISLCGNIRPCGTPPPEPPPPLEGVTELRPEFQFTSECGMEYRLRDQENNIVQDWQAVAGWVDNAAACFGVGGGDMATVEEICEAIECGMEKIAARFLSGTVENLAGGDIVLTPGQAPTVVPPGQAVNDPTTLADEEARAGGSIGIRLGMNLMLSYLSTWYTGSVTEIAANIRLQAIFDVDDLLASTFVSNYYTARGAAQPFPASYAGTLAEYMYCKGRNINTMNRWAYDKQAANVLGLTLDHIACITESQLTVWYNNGAQVPATDYVGYSCVPVDDDSINFVNPLNTSSTLTLTVVQKINHRVRFSASGKTMNPDGLGGYQDFVYAVSAAGVATLLPNSTGIDYFAGVFAKPTALEVPFEPSGVYSFTRETLAAAIPQFRYRVPWTSGANGTISLELEDLGEV